MLMITQTACQRDFFYVAFVTNLRTQVLVFYNSQLPTLYSHFFVQLAVEAVVLIPSAKLIERNLF